MVKKILSSVALYGVLAMGLSQAGEVEPSQVERTLSIVKPDAVQAHHIGQIVSRFEQSGLHVVGAKLVRLSEMQAKEFYLEHKDRPFYGELVEFMCSGPVFVQVLEGKDAVGLNRKLMGATNPKQAEKGTIRADFGTDTGHNAVHGSDSLESAKKEIDFFFTSQEIQK